MSWRVGWPRHRTTVVEWGALLKYAAPDEPIAATTAELDALWRKIYGQLNPRRGEPVKVIMGRPIVEIPLWPWPARTKNDATHAD